MFPFSFSRYFKSTVYLKTTFSHLTHWLHEDGESPCVILTHILRYFMARIKTLAYPPIRNKTEATYSLTSFHSRVALFATIVEERFLHLPISHSVHMRVVHPWQSSLGRHPPRVRYPHQADTPLGRHPPPGQTPLLCRHSSGKTPPCETATAADGTHSTGMHSCYQIGLLIIHNESKLD